MSSSIDASTNVIDISTGKRRASSLDSPQFSPFSWAQQVLPFGQCLAQGIRKEVDHFERHMVDLEHRMIKEEASLYLLFESLHQISRHSTHIGKRYAQQLSDRYKSVSTTFHLRSFEQCYDLTQDKGNEQQRVFFTLAIESTRYYFTSFHHQYPPKDEIRPIEKMIAHAVSRIYQGSIQCVEDHFKSNHKRFHNNDEYKELYRLWFEHLISYSSRLEQVRSMHSEKDKCLHALLHCSDVRKFREHLKNSYALFEEV